jgi:hypothetical protein
MLLVGHGSVSRELAAVVISVLCTQRAQRHVKVSQGDADANEMVVLGLVPGERGEHDAPEAAESPEVVLHENTTQREPPVAHDVHAGEFPSRDLCVGWIPRS